MVMRELMMQSQEGFINRKFGEEDASEESHSSDTSVSFEERTREKRDNVMTDTGLVGNSFHHFHHEFKL
jgi:hypothetical protein